MNDRQITTKKGPSTSNQVCVQSFLSRYKQIERYCFQLIISIKILTLINLKSQLNCIRYLSSYNQTQTK